MYHEAQEVWDMVSKYMIFSLLWDLCIKKKNQELRIILSLHFQGIISYFHNTYL